MAAREAMLTKPLLLEIQLVTPSKILRVLP
jgi:hypothetical protein